MSQRIMGTINQRLGNLIFLLLGHLRHNLTHHHELELQTSLTFPKQAINKLAFCTVLRGNTEGEEQAVENYYIKLNYYYVEIMRAAISFQPERHKFPPRRIMQIPLKVHVWKPLRKSESIFLLNGSFKRRILMTVNRIGSKQLKGTFSVVLARTTFLYYFFVKTFLFFRQWWWEETSFGSRKGKEWRKLGLENWLLRVWKRLKFDGKLSLNLQVFCVKPMKVESDWWLRSEFLKLQEFFISRIFIIT